ESAIITSNHISLALSISRNPSLSTKNAAGISCIKWQKPCLRKLSHVRLNQQWKGTRRKSALVQAVAVPVAPPSELPPTDNTEHLKQLAESYGFQQIGEPLPDDVTMRDIITSLPKKVFEINDMKAWGTVLISVTSYALGIYMIAKAPWYLLPLAWAWTGTAITGFFVIGHDCAHKSFSKNKLLEDIVGTLAFMPLIYPYEPWRFKHDQHHAKTNMLREDTAWLPIMKEDIEESPALRKALILGYGPLRTWMSVAHWLRFHFDLKKFRKSEVKRATISIAAVSAFMMSTFTIVHHTAPHIPFKDSKEWNAAQAQLNGTVHCDYPRWIEVLCHDINVHIPHHISPKIPSYNLRAANQSLNENWGKYLNKAVWNWRLMRTIMTTCHIYDKEENYVSFEKAVPEESQPISFLKRVMPDYA
uniref:Fatty acid desaturase domain-containing protein n=1 Tax=Chenopodium quinoa TaxID=63459 RepID=A0A803LTG4_CHEQI